MTTAWHIPLHVAGFLCVAATLPLVIELAGLSLSALLLRNRTRPSVKATTGTIQIIVPAHNESVLIGRCVESLIAAADEDTSIAVIAHNCSDNTAQLAEQAGANAWVRNDDGSGGKGAALHYGFNRALAEGASAVIVIDADSTVSPHLVDTFRAAFARGAEAAQATYIVANAEENDRTRLLGLSFLGINLVRPLGRDRLGLSCGIFGNGFGLTAATLRAVPYTAHSVVEDLEYHLMLISSGRQVRFLDNAHVYGEMPNNSEAAATQRARWEGGRSRMRRIYTPRLAAKVLRGDLRLLEPLLDLLTLPLANGLLLLLLTLALPLPATRIYSAAGLSVILLHVLTAATLSAEPRATLGALASVPRHILFKAATIVQRRHASGNAASWERTRRNEEPYTNSTV